LFFVQIIFILFEFVKCSCSVDKAAKKNVNLNKNLKQMGKFFTVVYLDRTPPPKNITTGGKETWAR
jgi:hypothetical protein